MAFLIPTSFPNASSSEIIRVDVILIPDAAKVIPNI